VEFDNCDLKMNDLEIFLSGLVLIYLTQKVKHKFNYLNTKWASSVWWEVGGWK
jgi:hypothetical protein